MSHTCVQCGKEYTVNYKVGNADDGATRTLCSMACYLAHYEARQDRREKQDAGPGQLMKLLLAKLTGSKVKG